MSHVIGRGKYGRETYPRSPGSGGGAAGFPFISVLNTAALAAFPVAGLVEGQPAAIRDRSSLWAYNPQDSSPADGWHIPSATGPGCWTYTGAFDATTKQAQITWFVDPANATGTASDDNDGLTQATALLTKAEIIRRWGTVSPNLSKVQVTIHNLSSDNGSDPGIYEPFFDFNQTPGNGFLFQAAPLPATPQFTGSLLAVTPKDQATKQALQSTFTVATGAVSAGMLLVNTTRNNSRAFAFSNPGGGDWILSQPCDPYPGDGSFFNVTENDTWADGDSIVGYLLIQVDLEQVSGISHRAWQLSSLAAAIIPSYGNGFTFIECQVTATIPSFNEVGTRGAVSVNTYIRGSSIVGDGSGYLQEAGVLSATFAGSVGVTSGTDQSGGAVLRNDAIVSNMACVGLQEDSGGAYVPSTLIVTNAGFVTAPLYGPGTLYVSGKVTYSGTAVANLNVTTLELEGVATGYSNATAAGTTTVHGGIALTAANLDAAAGAAGFGGYAYGGGATIVNSGIQP